MVGYTRYLTERQSTEQKDNILSNFTPTTIVEVILTNIDECTVAFISGISVVIIRKYSIANSYVTTEFKKPISVIHLRFSRSIVVSHYNTNNITHYSKMYFIQPPISLLVNFIRKLVGRFAIFTTSLFRYNICVVSLVPL